MSDDTLPLPLRQLVDRGATLVRPPRALELGLTEQSVESLCRIALASPIGAPRLHTLASPSSRVVVIVSDATRDEPRIPMLRAIREELAHVPDDKLTIVIASGTHAPRDPRTVLDDETLARHPVVVHDGHDPSRVIDVGTTPAGTRVRLLDVVARADIVISTGRIRPHYFAGMSGGAKGIFPGCAFAIDARQNHLWKSHASARLGKLDDNLCRLDMESAARLVPGRTFLLNAVADVDGSYVHAVAGDIVDAHRAACIVAEPLFVRDATNARAIVASDLPPVTDSLYQASKLLPPAGPLLLEDGVVVIAAECPEGIGPLQTVNEGIYQLGVRHHLPAGHRVRLLSSMPEDVVSTSYATHTASLDASLAGIDPRDVTVLWRAGELITRLVPARTLVRRDNDCRRIARAARPCDAFQVMRKVLAGLLGLVLGGAMIGYGAGLADAGGLGRSSVLGAMDGGIAPAISLAGQGLVLPPAVDDIEEMCALLIGCPDVPLAVPSQDLGECVRALWKELSVPESVKFSIALRECGLRANSCKELRECGLRGASPDVCANRGMDHVMSFCDESGRAVTCNKGKLVQVRDCPRFGEQCAAKGGNSTCYLGSCPADIPSDGTPVCSTNGAKIFVCDAGKLLSFDCGAFGLACVKGPEGKPTCAATSTPACSKDLAKCDGDDHVGCVGGHEVKVECAKAGMKCASAVGKDTVGACIPPTPPDGQACAANTASKCVGNDVQYCAGGKTRKFFCKGLGFSKCAGGPGTAHCAL